MNEIIIETLSPAISLLLTALTSILVGFAIRWVNKKTGLEISEAQEAKLKAMAVTAVKIAEEKAKAMAKHKDTILSPEQTFGVAMDTFKTLAPEIKNGTAEIYVMGAVAETPGIGATSNKEDCEGVK